MSLNFMKSAGVGFITTGAAALLIGIFPFRAGEAWAQWALPLVLLTELVLMLFRIADVKRRTPADPPLGMFAGMAGLTVCGFVLSVVSVIFSV